MLKFNKGFTLIELIIVIAIIGLITTIIVPKFSTTRKKSNDVSFRMELDNFRKKAEIYYSEGNTYTGLFDTSIAPPEIDPTVDASIQELFDDLLSKSADGKLYGTISNDDYALYGRIPGVATTSLLATDIWCIDNKGKSNFPSVDAVDQFTTDPATECW